MQKGQNIGQSIEVRSIQPKAKDAQSEDFVLEKSIFNNVFEKDIRRVFIYKKAERLAKAVQLITPAFSEAPSLKNRTDAIAVGLIDAATLPPGIMLSRELLSLSSILSVARASKLLSPMNTEIIMNEAHSLLKEVAGYEEPRLFLEDVPTLSHIAKSAVTRENHQSSHIHTPKQIDRPHETKGHIKDTDQIKDRRETILSVIRNKHQASIKDISTLIRGVSEKTVQRELVTLVETGLVLKKGERRWSTYSLA